MKTKHNTMNNKEKLTELARYFEGSRQVGHTTAMMEGAKNTECLVLAPSQRAADFLKQLHPKGDVVSFHAIHQSLRELRQPMVIDNAAMVEVLGIALGEINLLEARIEAIKEHLL